MQKRINRVRVYDKFHSQRVFTAHRSITPPLPLPADVYVSTGRVRGARERLRFRVLETFIVSDTKKKKKNGILHSRNIRFYRKRYFNSRKNAQLTD